MVEENKDIQNNVLVIFQIIWIHLLKVLKNV
jgi:hypothetical protein